MKDAEKHLEFAREQFKYRAVCKAAVAQTHKQIEEIRKKDMYWYNHLVDSSLFTSCRG